MEGTAPQWVNQYQAKTLVPDNIDAEHTEALPRGRTNHAKTKL
jgi:hypothetical protein